MKDKNQNIGALYSINWRVDKYRKGEWYDTVEIDANLLLNAGRDVLYQLIMGSGGTPFNAANSVVWVGNGVTAADAGQTAMQGASSLSKGMESGFPTVASGAMRFKARFLENEANFTWNEFGVSNGSVMLNRKVQSIGTKTIDDEWVFTVEIRFQ